MTSIKSQIAAARALADAATNGPWFDDDGHVHSEPQSRLSRKYVQRLLSDPAFRERETDNQTNRPETEVAHCDQQSDNFDANVAFIAASRTLVPQLADALERACELLEEMHGYIDETEIHDAVEGRVDALYRKRSQCKNNICAFLAGEVKP